MKRAILIVIDSAGIGAMHDAHEYGDTGSNTIVNVKRAVPQMKLTSLIEMGLGNIEGAELLGKCVKPTAAYGKISEASKGKDTTTGHWEIAGIITEKAFPVFPSGFPSDIIKQFEIKTGRKVLGNYAASGTEILEQLGEEHVKTGFPIVYTSADSVFQIAAHEEVISLDELYSMCLTARQMLSVGRVIARPFVGSSGNFKRTANRKDFSLKPPSKTMLDYIKQSGLHTACVGKIEDIFCGQGITEAVHTFSNSDGIDKTINYLKEIPNGLIFTNLVDTDMIYGHRNDVEGYANALDYIDSRIWQIKSQMQDDDILIITADHGCDPTMPGTDHSREYVPLLIYGKKVSPRPLGTLTTFADIGSTIMEHLDVKGHINGKSILNMLTGLKTDF